MSALEEEGGADHRQAGKLGGLTMALAETGLLVCDNGNGGS